MFVNKIRRLAGLAGFTNDGLNNIVRLKFVNGFPDISLNLKQASQIMTILMSHIIFRARILLNQV